MPITPIVIADQITDELPKIFNDAVENERLGQPNFIKDGNPQSVVGKVAQAISRSACRNYGAQAADVQAAAAGRYEIACRPYLNDLNPGGGVELGIPYEGGQCSARYDFTVATTGPTSGGGGVCGTGTTSGSTANRLWGPITNFRRGATFCTGPNGTASIWEMDAFGSGANGAPSPTSSTFTVATNAYTAVPGNFVRTDGNPDDCGDPPPTVTQPRPDPDPTPPPFRFNPGPGVDVNIDVDVNPDGSINFDIGTGPITIDPFGGDGGGDGGGGGGGGAPADPVVSPPTDGTGGGGEDDDFGPPEPGRIWVGCIVELLGDLKPFGVVPSTGPQNSVLTRVVGNASLIVPGDNSGIIRFNATQIRSQWSEHLLGLTGLAVTGIRVNINPSLTYRLWRVSIADPKTQEVI